MGMFIPIHCEKKIQLFYLVPEVGHLLTETCVVVLAQQYCGIFGRNRSANDDQLLIILMISSIYPIVCKSSEFLTICRIEDEVYLIERNDKGV